MRIRAAGVLLTAAVAISFAAGGTALAQDASPSRSRRVDGGARTDAMRRTWCAPARRAATGRPHRTAPPPQPKLRRS